MKERNKGNNMQTLKHFRDIRQAGNATISDFKELFGMWLDNSEKMTIGENAAFKDECRKYISILGLPECNAAMDEVNGDMQ